MNRNSIVSNFAKNLNVAANSVATPLTNMATNIANVISANTNNGLNAVMNATNTASIDNKIFVWVSVIGIVALVIYLIKRFVIDAYPETVGTWLAMFRSEQHTGAAGAVAPPLVPLPREAAVHPDTESWCFVGEDMTGRYCVKVPSTGACEASRTYKSRQDCEMVPAQHLPASVVTKQGAGALPLLSGN
jgi:hypothetical protein